MSDPRKYCAEGQDVVDAAELVRLRAIANHVWNYLGTRDPGEVANWIGGAILEMRGRQDGGIDFGKPWMPGDDS